MTPLLHVAALACAVMGGVYFTFSSFVMRALGTLTQAEGARAMRSINEVILSSGFMPLFWASSLAALGLAVWSLTRWGSPGAALVLGGGALYVLGMFVCTAAFNVPLNEGLDVVDATSAEGAQVWADYLVVWTRYNHLRTVCSVGAAGLFLAAAVYR